MTISEIYYNLFNYLDMFMSIEFTFCDITFTLWGLFLSTMFLSFIGIILFTGIKKDYGV